MAGIGAGGVHSLKGKPSTPIELLACELKAFNLRREARPEDRRIERIFEAVAHECRISS
jgi:hypothetical protein